MIKCNDNGPSIAVWSVGCFSRLIRSCQFSGIVTEKIKFSLVPVRRRHLAVYITLIFRPYDIRILCVCYAVSTSSLISERNSSVIADETAP